MSAPVTMQHALEDAYTALTGRTDSARLDAEILLAHVLAKPRSHLHAWPDRRLDTRVRAAFEDLVGRRLRGEPVAYLTGRREFWSLTLEVTADTLIPRPETEHLVESVLACISPDAACAIADLGTGCGAIALAIASERPACRVLATDISRGALRVAQRNAARLGLDNLEFRHGDWCTALDGAQFDLIACNPPYVPASDPCLRIAELCREPPLALLGGSDGLDAIDTVADGARGHLRTNGALLLEHGFDQAARVHRRLTKLGYTHARSHRDLAGHERITQARWHG